MFNIICRTTTFTHTCVAIHWHRAELAPVCAKATVIAMCRFKISKVSATAKPEVVPRQTR